MASKKFSYSSTVVVCSHMLVYQDAKGLCVFKYIILKKYQAFRWRGLSVTSIFASIQNGRFGGRFQFSCMSIASIVAVNVTALNKLSTLFLDTLGLICENYLIIVI